jgi:hypothetical protein
MPVILLQRILEPPFFVKQNLRPFCIILASKNPTIYIFPLCLCKILAFRLGRRRARLFELSAFARASWEKHVAMNFHSPPHRLGVRTISEVRGGSQTQRTNTPHETNYGERQQNGFNQTNDSADTFSGTH